VANIFELSLFDNKTWNWCGEMFPFGRPDLADSKYGTSVSTSNGIIAVGSPKEQADDTTRPGAAHVARCIPFLICP